MQTARIRGPVAACAAGLLAVLFLAVMLVSCATLPVIRSEDHPLTLLPPQPGILVSVGVAPNRDTLRDLLKQAGIDNAGVNYLVEQTVRAWVCVTRDDQGRGLLNMVASGSYSRTMIMIGLSTDRSWKEQSYKPEQGREMDYWYQERSSLALAVPDPSLIFAAMPEMESLLLRAQSQPAGVPDPAIRDFLDAHDIALYLPGTTPELTRMMEQHNVKGLALSNARFWLKNARGVWTLGGRLELLEGRQPGLLTMLVKLGMASLANTLTGKSLQEIASTLVVEAKGNIIDLSGLTFTNAEIAALIKRAQEESQEP